MAKKNKKLFFGLGKQITATISVALVLLILGIVGALGIATQSVTDNIRENLGFTLVMREDLTDSQANALKQTFTQAPYVNSYTFMSAEEILKQEGELTGIDIMDVVGVNPYQPEFNIKVKAAYANADSIDSIVNRLEGAEGIDHTVVHTEMINDMNANIRAITLILLAVAVALLIVSFVLINNTVRLTIYSRRFILHSMQLVGATASFIRRPILVRNIINGLIASILAMAILIGIFCLINSDPQTSHELTDTLPLHDILLIFGGMAIAGMIICGLASYFATNKYLRQDYDDLF